MDDPTHHISTAGAAALYTSLTMIAMTWITIGLRFYTRKFIVCRVGTDDWAILVTGAFFTGFCVTLYQTFAVVNYGNISNFHDLNTAANYLLSTFLLYLVGSIGVKISVMFFFIRIVVMPWQRWTMYICTAIFTAYTTGFFFETLFECGNPHFYLQHRLTGDCLPKDRVGIPLAYMHGILNAVVDWTFTGIAIMVILSLQMSRKSKNMAIGLLALGGMASVCSIVRVFWLKQLETDFVQIFTTGFDIGTLSCLEIGLGIVASSLATLKPLFQKVLPKNLFTTKGYSVSGLHPSDTGGDTRRSQVTRSMSMSYGNTLANQPARNTSVTFATKAGDHLDAEHGIMVVREQFLAVEERGTIP